MTMTYDQLLDRIISDGIAEVRVAYADPKDHHKRDGAIDGFEACRGKTPAELVTLWTQAERQGALLVRSARSRDQQAVRDADDKEADIKDYWRSRYFALQIEWVLNVISVGLQKPLLGHLPTARGAMKYATIVGVREAEVLS